ncbi:MAG: AMP-binding protein [Treponema sp.]|nr:AMP-binding protein [Treponema sp.]
MRFLVLAAALYPVLVWGGRFVFKLPLIVKLYPVFTSALFLAVFGATLVFPPSMAFRLALLMDKKKPHKIKGTLGEGRIAAYCREVTALWCLFFALNGAVSVFTIFRSSGTLWALYNGGISYIIMGILFGTEWWVRKMVDKSIPRAAPLSAFTPSSREGGRVICYSGCYGAGNHKTWNDFLAGTAALRRVIGRTGKRRWILYCDDYWYFLLGYTALLQLGKETILTGTISPAYIAEIISGPESGGPEDTAFLTDRRDAAVTAGLAADGSLDGSPDPGDETVFYIPDLVEGAALPAGPLLEDPVPVIRADETVIVMYTSGTTGRPKAVRQRLTEFENDNAFILAKWGEEFLARKLCSTVSPHHIYGLLFSVMLPFTAGIPFRRERIEYPETFRRLVDDSYLIVTVPALLKRSVEAAGAGGEVESFGLRSPWIFTSGGAVPPDVAEATERVFGFWPLEVYGSTETSGIAWRQSKDGPAWNPFDNAELSRDNEGRLVVKSPYIRDPRGFTTGDLVEFLPGGRFLLQGRADSIVKIEEKRISLPEVENRIRQTGLVSDAAVIALQDKRQYLAAAVVFNEQGRERFAGREKLYVNRYFREQLQRFFENVVIPKKWRYLEELPRNPQGKLKKESLERLFRDTPLVLPGEVTGLLIEGDQDSAALELDIPGSSPYFDGHFPGFPILPAAAQFELVLACAAQVFGLGAYSVLGARRLKFKGPILPGAKPRLELNLDRDRAALRFTITSPAGDKTFASGTIGIQPGASR